MTVQDAGKSAEKSPGAPRPHGRTLAEWTLFGACLAVVVAVAAAIVWLWVAGSERPPRFSVTVGNVEPVNATGSLFPVEIRNTGTRTAADVHVVARHHGGQPLLTQVLDFVHGEETVTVNFVLRQPSGEVVFEVAGFRSS